MINNGNGHVITNYEKNNYIHDAFTGTYNSINAPKLGVWLLIGIAVILEIITKMNIDVRYQHFWIHIHWSDDICPHVIRDLMKSHGISTVKCCGP